MNTDEITQSLHRLRQELDIVEKYLPEKFGTIYALYESGDSSTIHYVGATTRSVVERLRLHKSKATFGGTTQVCGWIREVIARGNKVLLRPLLERVSVKEIWQREREFIQAMQELFPLKNGLRSGSVNSGSVPMSSEDRSSGQS